MPARIDQRDPAPGTRDRDGQAREASPGPQIGQTLGLWDLRSQGQGVEDQPADDLLPAAVGRQVDARRPGFKQARELEQGLDPARIEIEG